MYLTGLSMGGGGTLWIGLSHPDVWAAIAPVCPAPPVETINLAPNALNLPVHFFQGGADPVVNPQQTRDWVAKMKQLGSKDVEYNEYPGVKHTGQCLRQRSDLPLVRSVQARSLAQASSLCNCRLRTPEGLLGGGGSLNAGTLATIDAQFTGANQIDVKTSDLGGFSLMLYGHPGFSAGKPLSVTVDGATIHVPPITSTAAFARTATGWKYGDASPGDGEKQQGSEGPLRTALSGRHIYVYGTADQPSDAETANRKEEAVQDAAWASTGTRLDLWLRTIADKEVRPSDWKSSDMILLGDGHTNSVIADMRKELPMQLSATGGDWNLTYIWPHDDHYVVVSSGADIKALGQPAMLGYLPVTPFPSVLYGLQDYVLFHNKQKVVEGRFTQDWKIPKSDAEKLKASGVVTLRQGASE